MEKNKKFEFIGILLGIGIGIVLLCLTIVLIFNSVNSQKNLDLGDLNTTEYLLIETKGEQPIHVYKDFNSTSMFITEGNSSKVVKTIKGPKSPQLGKLLYIRDGDELEGVEGKDITQEKELTYNTWLSGIADSERYLKFLKDQSYSCEKTVYSSQYIEKWFTGERDVKRVIITQKTISVVKVPSTTKYPSIESYIK